ncbi:deoxynucleoside triphosphate triphosphohydrolase SAMHD1-like isoform X1 [Littorina saxatilis]|uniref:HD/PDEase domain-containing protein n=1 Tax=Littorina saxatilis TaxID=31220 RepID=A0AAN9GPS1_9CAEN
MSNKPSSTRKRSTNAKSPTKESPAKQPRTESSQPRFVETSIEDKFHPDGSKVFNDPVHGHMEFHPLCVAIIDTPQFQRLRNLKQLGATYSVYPGAAHNRFEHSLGVGHLAGELVFDLRTRQPELDITWKDILCVQIAGLCHDLGHGPFSHLFEHRFVPATRDKSKPKWTHEEASVNMFNYMVEQEANELKEKFRKWDFHDGEITFMKDLILGKHPRGGDCGYGKEKPFLYEIVANKRNGVDVDKWDYFRRDCLQLGIFSSFDHTRFMKFARVIHVEEEGLQICVREKEALDVYQMFHTRHSLHLKAYQHKSAYVIGVMLIDAIIAANDHITIPGDNGKLCKMSECVDEKNIDAYMNLTDNVVSHILLTDNPNLEVAKKLLRDVERRKLYKCVGESMPSKDSDTFDEKMVEDGINEEVRRINGGKSLTEQYPDSKFVVQVVKLDFGKGDQNPVDHLLFFSKHDKTKAVHVRPAEVSSFLPQVVFKEQLVRVFFRLTDNPKRDLDSLKMLQEGFQNWCKSKIGEKGFKFFNIPKTLANQAAKPN